MKRLVCLLTVCVLAFCQIGAATDYYELVPWSTITNGWATQHYAAVVDGTTSYHTIALNSGNEIVKVTNLGGTQVRSTVLSPAAWVAASSGANMTNFYGFSLVGDYLQFAESVNDCVWRVNKDTGDINKYVSKAAIASYLGIAETSVGLGVYQTAYNGQHYFYESNTDNILKTTGQDSVEMFMTAAQLTTLTGGTSVSGGLELLPDGNLYFGVTANGLYKWDPLTDTGSLVLAKADILNVGGGTSLSFRDLLYAPDGYMYFFGSTTAGIMKFDPANPVATLTQVLSGADLTAGPAGNTGVYQFTWYDGNIAFNENGERGLYYVPEPATLLLLAMGGLVLRRKNRC